MLPRAQQWCVPRTEKWVARKLIPEMWRSGDLPVWEGGDSKRDKHEST